MTPTQLQSLDQHLKTWREQHPDTASLRAAYRQRVVAFALSSMALEQEPVDRERLQSLLTQPDR